MVLLVIFFWRFTLLGEAFVPTDLYFQWPPWDSIAPPGFLRHNPWISDRADGFYPARFFAREMLHRGELPLWDPHVLSGRPLAATLHEGLLYPLEILMWLLPLDFTLGLHAMLRLFLAGFFTYLFLRELDVGTGGALIGAIVFTYNSFHIIWLGIQTTYPSPIAPLAFWLAERLIKRPNGTYTCLLGLAIASMVAGGFVTVAAYFLYAVGFYYLLRVFQKWWDTNDLHTGLRQLTLFALAAILGFLLIAPGVYGEIETLQVSSYVSHRIQSGSGLTKIKLDNVIRLFVPHYYGDPLSYVQTSFPELTGYLGILPWLLSAVALTSCWREWRTGYFIGLAVVSYGMVYGAPFNVLVGRLPVLNAGSPTRMLISGAFAIAGLAALGFDFLAQQANIRLAFRRRQIIVAVLLATTSMIAISMTTDIYILVTDHPWKPNSLIEVLRSSELEHFQIRNALIFALWILSGTNLILAQAKGWLPKGIFVSATAALLVLDIFNFGIDYNPTLEPELIMPSTPGVKFLQQQGKEQPFRILGLDKTLFPNSSSIYGLNDIRAHGIGTDRYEQYIGQIDPTAMRGNHGTISLFSHEQAQLDSPLLNLLNVRYILVSPDTDMRESRGASELTLIYAGEDMHIYENPSYFPRAYAVCQFQVTQNEQSILSGLADGSLDPYETVWLEEPPAIPMTNAGCISEQPQVIRYAANEFAIQAEMASPGFLVVSEVTYPGWQAYVDGKESHVYTANYLFRAVYLPEGTHEVCFAYVPIGFWIGVAISSATLTGIAGVLGRATWHRLRQRRAVKETAP